MRERIAVSFVKRQGGVRRFFPVFLFLIRGSPSVFVFGLSIDFSSVQREGCGSTCSPRAAATKRTAPCDFPGHSQETSGPISRAVRRQRQCACGPRRFENLAWLPCSCFFWSGWKFIGRAVFWQAAAGKEISSSRCVNASKAARKEASVAVARQPGGRSVALAHRRCDPQTIAGVCPRARTGRLRNNYARPQPA